jgi:hypothetical protein
MELNEFTRMALPDQADAVLERGTFLALRSQGEQYVALYHMGGFFCEVLHDSATDELLLAEGFAGTRRLEPYLERIQLPGL